MRRFVAAFLAICLVLLLPSCSGYALPEENDEALPSQQAVSSDLSSAQAPGTSQPAAVSSSTEMPSQGESSLASSQGQGSQPESSGSVGSGRIGDYEVAIRSARLSKDYRQKDVLIVTYDFTNHGQDGMSFLIAINAKAYQNGHELSMATITGDKEYRIQDMMKDVGPGETQQVQRAFLLEDTTSPVEAEVSELISMNKDCFSRTFDLTSLS
ncbi:DUF5067 domain-containing protein [Solibaculum mannosilyticum]|uniref:DUF5067 domain-containing protein n=1 Tax=Solibaculum mannosilyticum TaxID=2780922 RepID=A0A7I8CZF9_9FIRM|nr:DUF5067 domain-containing protein [Solibaculum mannosilyticum]BCI59881.1 hypothetical protein C12CBH8_05200 [Solibaculum mannosilyticum]CZT56578.1 hypothetical protein BN3661_01450 [Eubacteriaceae bacterium CHKCI005]